MEYVLFVDQSAAPLTMALFKGEEVVELHHGAVGSEVQRNDIFQGRVEKVVPGLQAAFVDIGLARNAYLEAQDLGGPLHRTSEGWDREAPPPIDAALSGGESLVVQIKRPPRGTKGARVSTRISLPGRWLVLLPGQDHVGVSRRIKDESTRQRLKDAFTELLPQGFGAIVRTAAGHTSDAGKLAAEVEVLLARWNQIATPLGPSSRSARVLAAPNAIGLALASLPPGPRHRVVVDSTETEKHVREQALLATPGEHFDIEVGDPSLQRKTSAALTAALRPRVRLPCGGNLIIEEGQTLAAIDVDSGSYVGGGDAQQTILTVNMEAAIAVARELRLRNIGGLVVVDFIDMDDPTHGERVVNGLLAAMEDDPANTVVLPMSPLGLVEISRQRLGPSLSAQHRQPCEHCGGRGSLSH